MPISAHVTIGALCAALAASVFAQPKADDIDVGKREYDANCAVCHGEKGKGDGSFVELLKKAPPDLTQLAKGNGGILPMERLYKVIEGADMAAHGTRDMPIWGREYSTEAAKYYVDVPYDSEAFVRARILALLEYINRLQVK